jgi:hypothetical protein
MPADGNNGTLYAGLYYENLEDAEKKLEEINSKCLPTYTGFFGPYKILSTPRHFKRGLNSEDVSSIVGHRMYENSRGAYQGKYLTDGLLEDDEEKPNE